MSHHIYKTEGFILGNRNFGESNKIFYILTKDIGLIGASAQGVRELKSKLKFSLQDFGHVKVDTVKGRGIWRLINAENITDLSVYKNQQKTVVIMHIFSLLRRLINGEEKNEQLFNIVLHFISFINDNKLSEEELRNLEVIVNLKILNNLGYGASIDLLNTFLVNDIDRDLLSKMSPFRGDAIVEINSAIKESQL